MIHVDGTGLTRVTFNETFDGFPMFTRDGKRLVFASNRNAGKAGRDEPVHCRLDRRQSSTQQLRFFHASRDVLPCPSAPGFSSALSPRTSGSAITAPELREHVKYLASDELEGRGSGTEGNAKAAIYIAVDLKLWGLKPAGDNGTFFQTFDFTSAVKPGETNALMLETGGKRLQLRPDKDFRPFGFSSNDTVVRPHRVRGVWHFRSREIVR